MAKKVILPNEVVERISEFLEFLPSHEDYVLNSDFYFNFYDEQIPVVITLKLLKINN